MNSTIATPDPEIVSRSQWCKHSVDFLVEEKELTRLNDELARRRRELHWTRIEKEYAFDGPWQNEPCRSV